MEAIGWLLAAGVAGVVESYWLAIAGGSVLGLLGVTDWILGDEDDEAGGATDGGAMFDEQTNDGGDGEFGFDDGGGDDAFDEGGDDAFDDGGGDAFDELDMGGMDDGGGGSGSGPSVSDLRHRVDGLEDEIADLSSTVSTVKTENEQISESVDEIEENIRKLLDIYKMVTKGVNPFVDQEGGGALSAAVDEDTLGLFEDETESEEAADLDEDVAEADAEEFFDDDFGDESEPAPGTLDDDGGDGMGSFDDGGSGVQSGGSGDETQSGGGDSVQGEPADDVGSVGIDEGSQSEQEAASDGGAKSFDQLREEYEEGAEWADEAVDAEQVPGGDDAPDDAASEEEADGPAASADELFPDEDGDEGFDEDAAAETDVDEGAEDGVEPADDDRVDALFDEAEADAAETEPAEPEADSATEAAEADADAVDGDAFRPETDQETTPEVNDETESTADPEREATADADAGAAPAVGHEDDWGRHGERPRDRDPYADPRREPAPRTRRRPRDSRRAAGARGREKPYLRELPGGYVADLIVMEWVEFLIDVGGADGAERAVTYYENVEWLGPRAATQFREFLEGHPERDHGGDASGGLAMDHHTTSLRYIARLNGGVQENVLDSWGDGGNRWLHR